MSYERLRFGRVSLAGSIYHVTTATHDRQKRFVGWTPGRAVVNELKRLQDEGFARTLAFVVMPDHLHWLLQVETSSLAQIMNLMKGRTSHGLGGPLWQPSYHDHAIRDDEDLRAVARYLVMNPVRAGLVSRLGDYPLWDAAWVEQESA